MILMIVFHQHANIKEYAMKKHFNSHSALDAIQNIWALRDYKIVSPVILFLFLLWPESLSDLIVDKTNRYGRCKPKRVDVYRETKYLLSLE